MEATHRRGVSLPASFSNSRLQAVLTARHLSVRTIFQWAQQEAKKRALSQESGYVLHMGLTWGLLADGAPRSYWPSDREVMVHTADPTSCAEESKERVP